MRRIRGAFTQSVVARLYLAGTLAFLSICIVAGAAIHHASGTATAVLHFYNEALSGTINAAELELQLERHRRVIETAPGHLERDEAESDRQDAERIGAMITSLLAARDNPTAGAMRWLFANLDAKGRAVLAHVANSSPDKTMAAVRAYNEASNTLLSMIRRYRSESVATASDVSEGLLDSSRRLVRWVIAVALFGLLIVGPICLLVVRSVARRLKGIQRAMIELAHNNTSVEINGTNDADEVGDMARAVSVFKANAVTLLEQKQQLVQLNGWFDIALNNMMRGLSMFDADHRLLVCNQIYRELYDLPASLCEPGTPIDDIISYHMRRTTGDTDQEIAAAVKAWRAQIDVSIKQRQAIVSTTTLPDGRIISVACQPLPSGGWVDTHTDVTEKSRAEQQIASMARQDPLTGVGNRYSFREQLQKAFEQLGTTGSFAVHWIDLDRFKEVNDTLGHPAGDALLAAVADRLLQTVRTTDFVARLGGDEFAIIQTGVEQDDQAGLLAERMLRTLVRPYDLLGQPVTIGASIGVALAPKQGTTPDTLLKNADIALYEAKTGGRGQVVFFRPEHELQLMDRRKLETDLKSATQDNQLVLFYQPILELCSGRVTSCEALLRWRHPTRGLVAPAAFIPLAEETGLIRELGEWALRDACKQAVLWPDHIRVSVNLSSMQFESNDLYEIVAAALNEAGLAPNRLELEVTETLLLRENAHTLDVLHKFRALGVSIALDDFGTGFASLSYLRSFPFDKIKIDQTFVRDLSEREDCAAIVSAVSGLSRLLHMKTVAEGIEAPIHLEKVAASGCDLVQGYYFSPPVTANELSDAILASEKVLASSLSNSSPAAVAMAS